tara:strand:+ start:13513 stop:13644 length:132 start_codon:yes stop_codon:yes gene_type:complete
MSSISTRGDSEVTARIIRMFEQKVRDLETKITALENRIKVLEP